MEPQSHSDDLGVSGQENYVLQFTITSEYLRQSGFKSPRHFATGSIYDAKQMDRSTALAAMDKAQSLGIPSDIIPAPRPRGG